MGEDDLREMEKQMKAERAAGIYDEESGFGQVPQETDQEQDSPEPQDDDNAQESLKVINK